MQAGPTAAIAANCEAIPGHAQRKAIPEVAGKIAGAASNVSAAPG